MEKLKLMLVDDQSLFTESLCTFLNNYAEDMRVVSKACNGREAVKFCEIEKPDVILMDINMPEPNFSVLFFKFTMADVLVTKNIAALL